MDYVLSKRTRQFEDLVPELMTDVVINGRSSAWKKTCCNIYMSSVHTEQTHHVGSKNSHTKMKANHDSPSHSS